VHQRSLVALVPSRQNPIKAKDMKKKTKNIMKEHTTNILNLVRIFQTGEEYLKKNLSCKRKGEKSSLKETHSKDPSLQRNAYNCPIQFIFFVF